MNLFIYAAALYCLYTGCKGLVITHRFICFHDRNIKNLILMIIGLIASLFCLYSGSYILICK